MNVQKVEDVKDTALKLDEIRKCNPENYFYLKGWIHCLAQKQDEKNRQPRKPTMPMAQLQHQERNMNENPISE